jgi:hypothetical protein
MFKNSVMVLGLVLVCSACSVQAPETAAPTDVSNADKSARSSLVGFDFLRPYVP